MKGFRTAATGRRGLCACALASAFLWLAACSDGGVGGGDDAPPAPPPPGGPTSTTFATAPSTSHFLSQATFGPTPDDVDRLTGGNAAEWFEDQLALAPTLHSPLVRQLGAIPQADGLTDFERRAPVFAFWINAVGAEDQLRQRMAFALSQILVVSNFDNNRLSRFYEGLGYYQDILTENAFGNYRDLLEEVTYSPAMGYYLTYMGNRRGNENTGRMPDENYARELLQLFTIGVEELNPDGSPVIVNGAPVETYDNTDITGLARVFTGLDLDPDLRQSDEMQAWASPMVERDNRHETGEKTFLGRTIPANTPMDESIDQALDIIMEHPNVGPFVGRQLIQRFVTSDPEPAYVRRVAQAFDEGRYVLPNSTVIGDGRKGDLAATLAAVLFDDEARDPARRAADDFGKVREPVLRFAHWARAFEVDDVTPQFAEPLWFTGSPEALAQQPYGSPSVFNFYRPGYVAPGTLSGEAGLTTPELQLINATSTTGYVNFVTFFAGGGMATLDTRSLERRFDREGVAIDPARANESFVPDYTRELALAGDVPALMDRIDLLLTTGAMTPGTRADITEAVEALPFDGSDEDARRRVHLAVILTASSPDFLVQQ